MALFYGEVFGRWCTWQCEHFKTFWVDVQLYLFMFRIQSVGACWVWGVGVRFGMWFPAEGELGWSLFVLWQCLAHQPTMVVVSKLRSVRTNCLQRFRVCMKKRYTSDRERESENWRWEDRSIWDPDGEEQWVFSVLWWTELLLHHHTQKLRIHWYVITLLCLGTSTILF